MPVMPTCHFALEKDDLPIMVFVALFSDVHFFFLFLFLVKLQYQNAPLRISIEMKQYKFFSFQDFFCKKLVYFMHF